jgi:hypothetical protein
METAIPQPIPTAPWYRQRWPWLLMIGPVWVIVGGIIMVSLASQRPDALVVDDYYKQGKAINQDLSRDRAATAIGARASLAYDPARSRLSGNVSAQGSLEGQQIRIRLAHSTMPEKDLLLVVKPDPRGDFEVALPMLEQARWRVVVEPVERSWRLAGAWQWPQQRRAEFSAN